MPELIYNIPLHRLPDCRIGRWIVRASAPEALVATLSVEDPERVVALQLLSLAADTEPLNAWAPGLPVELAMTDPAVEFPLLYRHTNLLDQHPVRVVIPVRPGFAKAVKTAVALNFSVRLEPGQPEPALIEELATVLNIFRARCWGSIIRSRRRSGSFWMRIPPSYSMSLMMAQRRCTDGWRESKAR